MPSVYASDIKSGKKVENSSPKTLKKKHRQFWTKYLVDLMEQRKNVTNMFENKYQWHNYAMSSGARNKDDGHPLDKWQD